ncbi:MAG: phosphoribosylanthranilate isomerase [Candidatus Eremiobacteraeota bacterium]|nr:phosphoribosylanthranilate isomerase [Candidatus Eremiobacteraeota bacterium]
MNAPLRTRIKFCGMQSAADVALAVEAGADAVGVIVAESPRRVAPADITKISAAIPPFVDRIGVVAHTHDDDATSLLKRGFTLQFSGEELPSTCEAISQGRPYIKAFHIRAGVTYEPADFDELGAYTNATWMFDSRVDDRLGGTGVPFMWSVVASVAKRRPIVVSGGLTPENVGACVRAVRPYAVDVRGGVETSDRKDFDKMRAFVRAVREADAEA